MSLQITNRLHALLAVLEADIRQRVKDDASVRAPLVADHRAEFDAGYTRQDFTTWLGGRVTQTGVAWILATVFVRFLEDNRLVTPRFLEPIGSRTNAPDDRWQAFIRATPTANRRDWMQAEFAELARHPALAELLGRANEHLWLLAPSEDGVLALLATFAERTDDGTTLRWSFADAELSTRFLGDLYQDLSDDAKKRFALLQTPDFVERFILDRTLEPAFDTFGVQWKDEKGGFRLIDPTVGSGHFLLGAFPRILKRWREAEPTTDIRILVQRTLDALHGTDINPFAVSIARFRLLIAALKACGITHLSAAPDFTMQIAAGDALLLADRGATRGTSGVQLSLDPTDVVTSQLTSTRYDAARKILAKGFHAVVGNPPYIQPPEDLNQAYRELYGSCSGKYALTCPFMERFVELALPAQGARPAGFVGKITSNSFMKREFGKKLVTQFFAKWDLTAAIDTSGAYIPGHGTPTVILFLRNQKPSKSTVRAVLGIRGEPSTPDDPSQGLVWRSILDQIEKPGSQSNFVSVEDRSREMFCAHPWSLSGGGAGDVKEAIEAAGSETAGRLAVSIGPGAILGEDDAFCAPTSAPSFRNLPAVQRRLLVEGDQIRDWSLRSDTALYFPYSESIELIPADKVWQGLWALRSLLWSRNTFSKQTYRDEGRTYWEYHQIPIDRNRTPLSIAFAEIATHNHFVLDRGGKVFNRTAPVIKLKPGATEDEHLALLGVLNSSTICFWLQQVCHNKGGPGGGASKDEKWHDFYAMTSTNIGKVPLPSRFVRVLPLAKRIDRLAQDRSALVEALRSGAVATLPAFQSAILTLHEQMIFMQEELDWLVYDLFGLFPDRSTTTTTDHSALQVRPGRRAFELALAKRLRAEKCETEWFDWFSIEPVCDPDSNWPADYRELVARRVALIEEVPALQLLEQPEFKRRWEIDPPVSELWRNALTERFLDKVEALAVWRGDEPTPKSVAQLADLLARDPEAVELAEHLTGTEAPEMAPFLAALLKDEHVPCAAGARYTESGLRKRQSWEATWDLQRKEDAIDAHAEAGKITADEAKARKKREVGDIPVPPKYDNKDFAKTPYWQARGKLDVAKERFISYPLAGGDKSTDLMLGWAGWDHYQQARAVVSLIDTHLEAGLDSARALPLLQGLAELLPWLSQWFGKDPEFGDIGVVYRGAWQERVQSAGLTTAAVRGWVLPKATKGRVGKKSSAMSEEEPK